jgi:hypothetical protein
MDEPKQIKPNQFVCATCAGVFDRSDEGEALAELANHRPDLRPEDCVLLCDDCYAAYRADISED